MNDIKTKLFLKLVAVFVKVTLCYRGKMYTQFMCAEYDQKRNTINKI